MTAKPISAGVTFCTPAEHIVNEVITSACCTSTKTPSIIYFQACAVYFVRSYSAIEERGEGRVADRGQGIKTLGPRARKQKTAHFVCQMTEG